MNSFLSYVGGKSKLADTIVGIMPEHKLYCEVFAGAAWVYFRKQPSIVEVLNDKNSELTNLYRVIKHHLPEFARQFDDMLVSREDFERLKQQPSNLLTDVQRAVKYYYLIRLAYSAKIVNPSFTISKEKRLKLKLSDIEANLRDVRSRLANTAVENLNYDKVVAKYDNNDTLFYLDPPYWNCEDYYGKDMFAKGDFERIVDMCGDMKGKFIVSINDVPEIRKMFGKFNIREVGVMYSLGANRNINPELLITNF